MSHFVTIVFISMSMALAACTNGLSVGQVVSGVSAPTNSSSSITPIVVPTTQPLSENVTVLRGVNLSGAEYSSGKTGARIFFDYVYPTTTEMDYYAAKGFKIIRLPFDGNRLQPLRGGPLSASEFALLDQVVQYAKTKNLTVLLDPHNYGALMDNAGVSRLIVTDPLMPASLFADFWSKIATAYLNQSNVIFGLMNEPNAQTAAEWKVAAVAAVKAIRAAGAQQKILIPGTAWTGAGSWIASGNAAAWAGFTDSNFAFEVHQYLDSDNSGTHTACVQGKGASILTDFTAWAKSNKFQAFMGEAGWSGDPSCPAEGKAFLQFMNSNPDVFLGFTYWAGGPWLGNYMFTIEPTGLGTTTIVDQPQMGLILQNL